MLAQLAVSGHRSAGLYRPDWAGCKTTETSKSGSCIMRGSQMFKSKIESFEKSDREFYEMLLNI